MKIEAAPQPKHAKGKPVGMHIKKLGKGMYTSQTHHESNMGYSGASSPEVGHKSMGALKKHIVATLGEGEPDGDEKE